MAEKRKDDTEIGNIGRFIHVQAKYQCARQEKGKLKMYK